MAENIGVNPYLVIRPNITRESTTTGPETLSPILWKRTDVCLFHTTGTSTSHL